MMGKPPMSMKVLLGGLAAAALVAAPLAAFAQEPPAAPIPYSELAAKDAAMHMGDKGMRGGKGMGHHKAHRRHMAMAAASEPGAAPQAAAPDADTAAKTSEDTAKTEQKAAHKAAKSATKHTEKAEKDANKATAEAVNPPPK